MSTKKKPKYRVVWKKGTVHLKYPKQATGSFKTKFIITRGVG